MIRRHRPSPARALAVAIVRAIALGAQLAALALLAWWLTLVIIMLGALLS